MGAPRFHSIVDLSYVHSASRVIIPFFVVLCTCISIGSQVFFGIAHDRFGYTWQQSLGLTFYQGILFLVLAVFFIQIHY